MSPVTLLWRQFNHERWPALVLALSVLLLSLVAGVVPRLMSDLDDRQLTQAVSGLSATQGDVLGSWSYDPYNSSVPLDSDGDPWAARTEAARAIRDQQPEPLASLLAEPEVAGQLSRHLELVPPRETGYYAAYFALLVDPQLSERAELIDGAWPVDASEGGGTVEVAVLASVAEKLGWTVGTEVGGHFVVSATFRPIDPTARRWDHVPLGRTFTEPVDPDRGTAMRAGLFLPQSYQPGLTNLGMQQNWESAMNIRLWFGLDGGQVRSSGVDVAQLSSQLTAMLAQRYPSSTDEGAPEVRLNSELNTALARVLNQQTTTRSVLAVAAVGPIAVAVALVILASRLLLQRREPWLQLVNARGLTPRQARWLAAIEGALLAVPAAVIGHLIALVLIPGPRPLVAWLGPALVALLAPAALAMGAGHVGTLRTRTDLGSKAGRWRVVGEVVAVAAALAATWQLLTRTAEDQASGVDLLGAATPALWTLAASLLVLRLYPLPLTLLARVFEGGRGLTSFLGTVRSLRDPAGGVVPIVTVLLGTTLAVMGATLVGTITTGTERATWDTNGSHIRLSGPRILDPLAEGLRALDGVAEVARIYDVADNAKIELGDDEAWGRVLLADPELIDVYAPVPGGSPVPASLFSAPSVLLGGDIVSDADVAVVPEVGTLPVAGTLEDLPGGSFGSIWVLADIAHWRGTATPTATVALISVEPGADMRAVADAIAQLVPNSRVTTVAAQLDALRDSPTIDGLTRAFLILAGTTAALMALGVVGSQLLTGGERNHLAAILRTLGLRPGQLRGLTAWEAGPAIVLALAVGVGLGIGLAALMLAGLDFSALTGGEQSPALHLHWPTLAAVLGALIATMALAVTTTSWFAGRTNLAQELRIGDQR